MKIKTLYSSAFLKDTLGKIKHNYINSAALPMYTATVQCVFVELTWWGSQHGKCHN